MKKRIFIGLSIFAFLFTLIAWQFAAAELAEFNDDQSISQQEFVPEE